MLRRHGVDHGEDQQRALAERHGFSRANRASMEDVNRYIRVFSRLRRLPYTLHSINHGHAVANNVIMYSIEETDTPGYSIDLFETLLGTAVDLAQIEANVSDIHLVQVTAWNSFSPVIIHSRVSTVNRFDPFGVSIKLMHKLKSDPDWDIEHTYITVDFFPPGY
jgi:hypothetical protein